ncbi:MAG: hypothetical protein ACLPOO_04405 [Terriglobales bacterium]|jgi:hypothetical protein
MMWWFLIFACGAGAALWAGIAAYLRVRRHLKGSTTQEVAKKSGVER